MGTRLRGYYVLKVLMALTVLMVLTGEVLWVPAEGRLGAGTAALVPPLALGANDEFGLPPSFSGKI